MRNSIVIVTIALVLSACSNGKVKEGINKTGDVAGQAIGELAQGMQAGIGKAFELKISIADSLAEKGIATGQVTYGPDSSENDNALSVYMIFNKTYKGPVTAKVYNMKQLEMGRCRVMVSGNKDDAQFVMFRFDKRTDIDNDSKIVLE
jgi:hypothetical protein